MAREHEVALSAVLAMPPRLDLSDGVDHAYVRHLDGLTYVCPWRLQLRAWDALDSFRSQLPDELRDAFFPPSLTAEADLAREAWVARHPEVKAGILTSTWQVPVAWFTVFEASERRLVLGDRRAASDAARPGLDRAMVYLTQMSRARRRVAQALRIVRRVFDEGPGDRGDRGRRAAGSRTSTRTRWSSSTTAGWCTCSTTSRCPRTPRWRRSTSRSSGSRSATSRPPGSATRR